MHLNLVNTSSFTWHLSLILYSSSSKNARFGVSRGIALGWRFRGVSRRRCPALLAYRLDLRPGVRRDRARHSIPQYYYYWLLLLLLLLLL